MMISEKMLNKILCSLILDFLSILTISGVTDAHRSNELSEAGVMAGASGQQNPCDQIHATSANKKAAKQRGKVCYANIILSMLSG